jgi:penicillin-binding protein 1B
MARRRGGRAHGAAQFLRTTVRSRWFWVPALLALGAFGGYLLWLDHLVTSRFDGRRWNLPAHVYARPRER